MFDGAENTPKEPTKRDTSSIKGITNSKEVQKDFRVPVQQNDHLSASKDNDTTNPAQKPVSSDEDQDPKEEDIDVEGRTADV